MKKIVLFFSFSLSISCQVIFCQVGINLTGSNPDPSAMMDVSSSTKGLLIPRMTQSSRNAIQNPATGLIVFQTDNAPGLYYNSGTPSSPSWVPAGGTSGLWQTSGNNVYYYEGNVGIMEMNPTGRLHVSAPGVWDGIAFTGTGLNDLAVDNSGYTGQGPNSFAIRIQNSGPDPNIIEISMNGGTDWSGPMPIAPNIDMGYGITANFNNDGGHTYNDRWDWTVNESFPDVLVVTDGNVGIGTANPTSKLQVENGDALINNMTIGKGGGSQSTNSAFGTEALLLNYTGNYNTACGFAVLGANSSGSFNTATGYSTLGVNSTGSNNTAIGSSALASNITGFSNTAIGAKALYLSTDRSNLVAVGDSALLHNGLGASDDFHAKYNTALGSKALYANTTGSINTSVGYNALKSNTTGSYNTAVGYEALYNNTTGLYGTAIGVEALMNNNAYANTAVGWSALSSNTTGEYNLALGIAPLQHNIDGDNNVGIGRDALMNNTYASTNIAIGDYALYTQSFSNSNASYITNNIAIGSHALYTNNPTSTSNGKFNIATGFSVLYSNTTGYNNSGFGYSALHDNTTGYANTAFGNYALDNITTGYSNTALGYGAGPSSLNSGLYNTTSIGNGAAASASNQVKVGNSSVITIGGPVDWTVISDKRFKEDVRENVPGLDFISLLRPVTYRINFKMVDDYTGATNENAGLSEIRTGFIAQEVEEAASQIGFEFDGVDRPKNDRDMYGLRYAEFVVPLVKAVQEQQSIIDNQQSKIESLQKQIDELYLKLSIFETK